MNEILSDHIAFLESVDFDIQVNILSGLNSFINALEEHERVRHLIELIKTSSAVDESLIVLAANSTLFWARRLAARFAQARQAVAVPDA
jgi:hypothetical protein